MRGVCAACGKARKDSTLSADVDGVRLLALVRAQAVQVKLVMSSHDLIEVS